MDFAVHRDPKALQSTCYIEIGPGPHVGGHWKEGFWFVADDAFEFAAGVVSDHFPTYDPYSINELPSFVALGIAQDLRAAADAIRFGADASMSLHLTSSRAARLRSALHQNGAEIADMLGNIAAALESSAQGSDWVCVLGL